MIFLLLLYLFVFIVCSFIIDCEGTLYFIKHHFVKKNIEKYNNKLAYDKDYFIRYKVAEQGIDKYLDILVDDEDQDVRYSVANYGNLEHCKKLLHDECICVEQDAYNRICEIKNKERELKQKKLINNEINDKPNNKIVKYEIVQ